MSTIAMSQLVLDYTTYPRSQVSSNRVAQYCEAMRAGAKFPVLVVERKSKRIVDGFHRFLAYKKTLEPESEIEVELRDYRSEVDFRLDTYRLNSGHGQALTPFDRARASLELKKLGASMRAIAAALGVRVETLRAVGEGRVATTSGGEETTLKRTIRHMAGHEISEQQEEANKKLSGANPIYLLDQVLLLLETDLFDLENKNVMERLVKLKKALHKIK